MKYKCKDCGNPIEKKSYNQCISVCDQCWENRGWLISNRENIDDKTFKDIQRTMSYGRGTVRRKIDKLKETFKGEAN